MLPFPFACMQHEVTRIAREKNAKFTEWVYLLLEQTDQVYYDPLYLYFSLMIACGPHRLPFIIIAISDLKARGYLEDYVEHSFYDRNQRRELIGVPRPLIKVNLTKLRTT